MRQSDKQQAMLQGYIESPEKAGGSTAAPYGSSFWHRFSEEQGWPQE